MANSNLNISHKYKIIFLAHPRTASGAIYDALDKYLEFENKQMSHDMRIPRKYKNYHIISSLRNPYSRFVSAWKWSQLHDTTHMWEYQKSVREFVNQEPSNFGRYLKYIHGDIPKRMQTILSSQSKYLDNCKVPRVDRYIRFEHLEEDLQKLLDDFKIEVEIVLPEGIHRSSYSRSWKLEYTPFFANLVYNIWKEDFVRFGFSKDLD